MLSCHVPLTGVGIGVGVSLMIGSPVSGSYSICSSGGIFFVGTVPEINNSIRRNSAGTFVTILSGAGAGLVVRLIGRVGIGSSIRSVCVVSRVESLSLVELADQAAVTCIDLGLSNPRALPNRRSIPDALRAACIKSAQIGIAESAPFISRSSPLSKPTYTTQTISGVKPGEPPVARSARFSSESRFARARS